jgi:hypothetical protein
MREMLLYVRGDKMNEFTKEELCILHKWYNSIQGLNPDYLDEEDKQLLKR